MSCQYPPSSSPLFISNCLVFPEKKSTLPDLKLSVSDLPMLSCHYIQKGVLLPPPAPSAFPSDAALLSHLRRSLSHTLIHFPPLAGRLTTNPSSGHIFITCNDAGVDFIHATAHHLTVRDHVLSPIDVPDSVRGFFSFASDGIVSYQGHFRPLLAVQVTELSDGVFIGCAVNHAVTDGTSFWNFFNAFAEVSRGVERISRPPDFRRDLFNDSAAVLKLPEGGSVETFSSGGADGAALRERIFHFRREAILDLKSRANAGRRDSNRQRREVEMMGKEINDGWEMSLRDRGRHEEEEEETGGGGRLKAMMRKSFISRDDGDEISSFQSLCAQVWRSVTRARRLSTTAETTFRMAVNWRHRVEPRLDPWYFGNAIQSVATRAPAGEVAWRDLGWSAGLLHESVRGHGDARVRGCVEEWEREPRCFPLGNPDGASITMGSSPRFPIYDNDFGWGGPIAVRSGSANKFDGKMSAFPGRGGGGDGSVDLEVCLSQDTMAALEADPDFMQYVYVVDKAN